jgi:hypothetical protein
MNQPDPLEQLRDIHTPDPISWWPLAPGWWILLFISLVSIYLLVKWFVKKRNYKTPQQIATRQLLTMKSQTAGKQELIEAIQLLRRVALSHYPEHRVASVNSLSLANQVLLPGQTISESTKSLLNDAQYRPDLTIDNSDWRSFIDELLLIINGISSESAIVSSNVGANNNV